MDTSQIFPMHALPEVVGDAFTVPTYIVLAAGEFGGSAVLIAVIAGLVAGGAAIKFFDMLRKRDIKTQAQAMLDQAKADATNVIRSAELEAKEKALQHKQAMESEVAKLREAVRKREAALDRREETLQQSAEDLRKQEKMVETNQRRAADKLAEVTKRSEEMQRVLQEQTQQLQRISA